jgi:phytoene dehydrogenase-like protein
MIYDLIVIGAGAGGSCCAAHAAKAGLKTMLLEKNGYIGGKAGTVTRYGHRTDLFTHIPVLAMSRFGHLREALEDVDKLDALQWVEEWPTTLVQYGDMSFVYPDDCADDAALLAKLGITAGDAAGKIRDSLNLFLRTLRGFPAQGLESLRDVTLQDMMATVPGTMQDGADISALLLFVVSARYASAGETIGVMQKVLADVPEKVDSIRDLSDFWMRALDYPKGGIGRICETFADVVRENGGEVRLGAPVDRIAVKDGKAHGVYVGGELIESYAVVSNAGVQATVLGLAGPEHFPADYVERVKAIRPSFGSARIRYFLDRKMTPHGLIVPYGRASGDKPREEELPGFEETRRAALEQNPERIDYGSPSKLGTMIVSPSNFDPAMSPHGKQVLIASCATTADHRFDVAAAEGWFRMIHAAVKSVIPDLEKHIEHIDYATSDGIARLSGRYGVAEGSGGECIGAAQVPGQLGEARPEPVLPVEGLFVAGADTGLSGIGVDLAVGSGNRVARLLKEYLT